MRLDTATADFLCRHGLIQEGSEVRVTPLTGGIASDICRVETRERTFVLKRALPQLRVSQEWKAPVSRNANEVDWMIAVGRFRPQAVPQILASDRELGLFAMTYFDPNHYPIWKQELMAGRIDVAFAAHVGGTMAAIHRETAGSEEVSSRFDTGATFHALRIEPYIEETARRHRDLAGSLMALGHDVLATRRALVHGDMSPKNILVREEGPVILDAECAWYGEPAFDLAFCLNHLLLKAVWKPAHRADLQECFQSLSASYLAAVNWEPAADVEARTARLLPALLLARVDGKSPVEYITKESDRECIRRVARPLIANPPSRLVAVWNDLAEEITNA